MIEWKEDKEHGTIEGWFDGVHLFELEPTDTGIVRLYQMKKPVGNCLDLPSMDDAKKYCEGIKPITQNP